MVDVIKPVDEPEEEAPEKPEPKGETPTFSDHIYCQPGLNKVLLLPVCPCLHSAETRESVAKGL